MISLPSFARKSSKPTRKIDRTRGSDGYRACDVATITRFQATIERESDCDYDALRAALLKARDPQFVVNMVNLRAAYNDGVYAAAQFAYAAR